MVSSGELVRGDGASQLFCYALTDHETPAVAVRWILLGSHPAPGRYAYPPRQLISGPLLLTASTRWPLASTDRTA